MIGRRIEHRAPPTSAPSTTTSGGEHRYPAVYFIIVYAFLLLCIPSRLIVGPLGAAGTPANLWGLVGLLWWAAASIGGLNHAVPRSPVKIMAGLVVVAVFASYAVSMTHGWYAPPDIHQSTDTVYDLVVPTIDEITTKMVNAADRGLMSFGGWLGIVLLTADGLRSRRDMEQLVKWITWFGSFVAMLGIVQYFTGVDIASLFKIPGLRANSDFGFVDARSTLRRVSSTAIHGIEFGVVMAAVLPLALHRTIHDVRSRAAWIPTLVIGLAIPMAVSRSATLVAGTALLILFLSWPVVYRRRALVIVPAAVVAMRVLAPGLVGTIVSLFSNFFNDPSITGRTDDYTVVFNLYSFHPWFGRGLFTFVPRYYRTLDNQFLVILIELGAVGFTVVMGLFLVAFFSVRGARMRTSNPQQRHLCLAISASIAGVLLSYATFDAWGFPMAAGITFLLVGMAGAAWNVAVRESTAVSAGTLEAVPSGERVLRAAVR